MNRTRFPWICRPAFSLMEMLAAIVLIGLVSSIVVTRVWNARSEADRQACFANKGDIETRVQQWWRVTGQPPDASLMDIGGDSDYFPSGVPTCPVDNTTYTIDSNTGHVVGHTH